MDDTMSFDVIFNENVSNEFFNVEEETLFDFFVFRKFSLRTNKEFSLRSIKGPYFNYPVRDIEIDYMVSVTFVYPEGDTRPFMIIVEKIGGVKIYYKLHNPLSTRITFMDELNMINKETQEKLYFDFMKKVFTEFFGTQLKMSESIMREGTFTHLGTKYSLIKEANYVNGYDRYHFKPNGIHSPSKIFIDGELMEFSVSLSYAKDFYVYYTHNDISSPLLIETFDYKIGDSVPLYNYYVRRNVESKEWIGVECSENLVEPKCLADIRRILNQEEFYYRTRLVRFDIGYHMDQNNGPFSVKFSGVYFTVQNEMISEYTLRKYKPQATGWFFVEYIYINNVRQEMDIQSTEIEEVYVYYRNVERYRPVLICFKLHNRVDKNDSFLWFYTHDTDKNTWIRLESDSHPYKDTKQIEEKMLDLYEGSFKIDPLIGPIKWFAVFTIGSLFGTYLGLRHRARLRLMMLRVYRYFRR